MVKEAETKFVSYGKDTLKAIRVPMPIRSDSTYPFNEDERLNMKINAKKKKIEITVIE